jgi:hypothetical protein
MGQEEKKVVSAKIIYPEVTEEDKPLYSNAILVNHTPWDFALHFCNVSTPIAPGVVPPAGLEIKAKKVAIINIPAPLVKGLINALQTNLARYEERYGKIEIPKEA